MELTTGLTIILHPLKTIIFFCLFDNPGSFLLLLNYILVFSTTKLRTKYNIKILII